MLERGEGWMHCHQPLPRWAVGEAPSAPGLGINPNALSRISQLMAAGVPRTRLLPFAFIAVWYSLN